jgi:dihydropteroate synthase
MPPEPVTQPSPNRLWRVCGKVHELGGFPWLMGIINTTPDSFSDGGRFLAREEALEQALTLEKQGARILDIGGESTRPGAEPVPAYEELRRVLPVIEALAGRTQALISIDTMKASVAEAAIRTGAHIVNDVSALTFDPRMAEVCAGCDCGVVVMHMQGSPQTMQDNPHYDNVVAEVAEYLDQRIEALAGQGIDAERIVLDPGIGFGKTASHNLDLLRNVATLRNIGRPVLIGHSRKRFLGKLLGKPIDERSAGTIGVSIALAQQQADILRVHDIGAVADAIAAWRAIAGPDRPAL